MTISEELLGAYNKKCDANKIILERRKENISDLIDAIMAKSETLDALIKMGSTADKTDFFEWVRTNKSFVDNQDPLWADDDRHNLGFRKHDSSFGVCVSMKTKYNSDDEIFYDDDGTLHIGYPRYDLNIYTNHTEYDFYDWDMDKIVTNYYTRVETALTTFRDSITAFDTLFTPLLTEYIDNCNNYYETIARR